MKSRILLLALAVVVVAQPARSEETDKSSKKVSLHLTMPKQRWAKGKTPTLDLIVKNDTDQVVRVSRWFFGYLIFDGESYRRNLRIPILGGDYNYPKYPPQSKKKHGSLGISERWVTGPAHKGEKPRPLKLKPGDHVVKFKLYGMTTNEIRFTVEP